VAEVGATRAARQAGIARRPRPALAAARWGWAPTSGAPGQQRGPRASAATTTPDLRCHAGRSLSPRKTVDRGKGSRPIRDKVRIADDSLGADRGAESRVLILGLFDANTCRFATSRSGLRSTFPRKSCRYRAFASRRSFRRRASTHVACGPLLAPRCNALEKNRAPARGSRALRARSAVSPPREHAGSSGPLLALAVNALENRASRADHRTRRRKPRSARAVLVFTYRLTRRAHARKGGRPRRAPGHDLRTGSELGAPAKRGARAPSVHGANAGRRKNASRDRTSRSRDPRRSNA